MKTFLNVGNEKLGGNIFEHALQSAHLREWMWSLLNQAKTQGLCRCQGSGPSRCVYRAQVSALDIQLRNHLVSESTGGQMGGDLLSIFPDTLKYSLYIFRNTVKMFCKHYGLSTGSNEFCFYPYTHGSSVCPS